MLLRVLLQKAIDVCNSSFRFAVNRVQSGWNAIQLFNEAALGAKLRFWSTANRGVGILLFSEVVLRSFRFKQCFPESSVSESAAQFSDIKSHCEDEEPGFVICFPSRKEPSEVVILFQNTERTFDLNRTVYPKENALIS